MAGAADPLQRYGNGTGRADLADQIHKADIDAQLERRGSHEHAHFASFQLAFRREAELAREAAVVRRHGFFAQPLGQMMRHALGKPPRIDEHQRGTVLQYEGRDAVVNLAPHFVGGHRAEFAGRHFDGDIHAAAMAGINDHGRRPVVPGEELRDRIDRLLRGGKADAHRRAREQSFEPFE